MKIDEILSENALVIYRHTQKARMPRYAHLYDDMDDSAYNLAEKGNLQRQLAAEKIAREVVLPLLDERPNATGIERAIDKVRSEIVGVATSENGVRRPIANDVEAVLDEALVIIAQQRKEK